MRMKRDKKMSRVNNFQSESEFNSQKEKLNILAEILEISKSGLPADLLYYGRPPSL